VKNAKHTLFNIPVQPVQPESITRRLLCVTLLLLLL